MLCSIRHGSLLSSVKRWGTYRIRKGYSEISWHNVIINPNLLLTILLTAVCAIDE